MKAKMTTSQLTLNVHLRDDATFTNYFIGDNGELIKNLYAMASGRGDHYLYFCGQSGCGRSHLLQACCHASNKRRLPSFYLSFKNINELQADVLEGLESMHLVCIDDIDKIAGDAAWEEAFFDFFNRMQDAKKRLIIAGDTLPQNSKIALPDLVSRLGSGITFALKELSDDAKIQAVKLHAHVRGFELSDAVAKFLWRRWPRDMHSLFAALDKLDQASLAAQHKITIPFVKDVLKL